MWRLCSAKGILHVRVVCVVLSEKSRIHRLEIETRLGSYFLSPPIKATKLQGPKLKITRKCHKWWAAIKISNHAQADNKLFHSSALLASSSPGRRYRKCDTFRLENSICIVCGRGCVCVWKCKSFHFVHGLMHPKYHKLYNIHHSTHFDFSCLLRRETRQIDGLFE